MKLIRQFFLLPRYRSNPLQISLIILSLIGVVMVTSASMTTMSTTTGLWRTIIRQMVYFILSYMMMCGISNLFSWRLISHPLVQKMLIYLTPIILIIPRFFQAQYEATGAYNWISLGFFTIQPSEFSKISILILVSFALSRLPIEAWMHQGLRKKSIRVKEAFSYLFQEIQAPIVSVVIMIILVLFLQKDLGTAMIMTIICAVMVLMASHPLLSIIQKPLVSFLLVLLVLGIFLLSEPGIEVLAKFNLLKGYQLERFRALYHMFDPSYSRDVSPQQYRGLLAFARGGLTGNGLGQSIQKYGYLPEAHSDYIIAVVIEEFGFVGFMVVTLLYFFIIFILMRYGFTINNPASRLYLIGLASYFFAHYFINIGGTSGLIPLTGVPLLLISSGGSSQMASYLGIGIAQRLISDYEAKRQQKL